MKGQWKYLFRAIDKRGDTIDFLLTARRDSKAAKRFLAKALRRSKRYVPLRINTDKNPAYGLALAELKREGKAPDYVKLRQVKYLNNRLESDHGKLKQLIKPTLGFQSMRTPTATTKGLEVMRMFKKGILTAGSGLSSEELRRPSSTAGLRKLYSRLDLRNTAHVERLWRQVATSPSIAVRTISSGSDQG